MLKSTKRHKFMHIAKNPPPGDVGKIKEICDDGWVYENVFEGPVTELKNELRRSGVGLEDARAITSVIARWAIGVKR